MLAVIRVFTSEDNRILTKHSQIIQDNFHINTSTYCIPEQPDGIHDEESLKRAIPKIIQTAQSAESDGASCIFISCAADPAVLECRKNIKIPVLGAGSCASGIALSLGNKIGILNLTQRTPPVISNLLGVNLKKQITPKGVNDTRDLLTEQGQIASINAMKELEKSCDVILLACTGFSTIDFASKMQKHTSIPLVDAVKAGGIIASNLLIKKF